MTVSSEPEPPLRQLPLDFQPAPRLGIEDYLVGGFNETAHRLIAAFPDWPGQCLLLVGPEGSGKTHLASICIASHGGRLVHGVDLSASDLAAVKPGELVGVEDADRAPEIVLFHLINIARERGALLLLTARQGPHAGWPHLADLSSRLRAMTRADIQPPDEAILRAVLAKLLDDRQLAIEPPVLDYLARHIDRSIGTARAVVEALDREALARGRAVGRKLASEVVARLGGAEPD